MGLKIKLDDKEYEVDNLSDQGKAALASLQFTNKQINELSKMQIMLQQAKQSFIDSLKREMITKKTGFFFDDDQKGQKMPKITVDGVEYNTEDLSENGKAQLASLQFLEAQMTKLKAELAVYHTARNSYMAALKEELDENKAD